MIKRLMFRLSVGVGIVVLLAASTVLIMGASSSAEVKAQGTSDCTLNTIYGTYLFQAQGVILDGEEALPYVEAGSWTLDGMGNAVGVFSASVDGVAIASQEAFTATYELNSGCAFTAFAPVGDETVEFQLYTTSSGAFMTYFGAGFSGTQTKQ